MSNLPNVAKKKKQTTQGVSLQSFVDDKALFSDMEDDNTETTEYELPTREEDPKDWHTWALFYRHPIKLELTKVKCVIGRTDRECWIRAYLEDSLLEEKREWWYDDEEDCLYIADEYFLMTWKMANCKQFEENVKCVVYSTDRQAD